VHPSSRLHSDCCWKPQDKKTASTIMRVFMFQCLHHDILNKLVGSSVLYRNKRMSDRHSWCCSQGSSEWQRDKFTGLVMLRLQPSGMWLSVEWYQHSERIYYLRIQDTGVWWWPQNVLAKSWYLSTKIHGVTSQEFVILIYLLSVRTRAYLHVFLL
jgi:hypothetical protein